ncbi:MAG TPA: diiron oxygenase [Acidimicrobiia bacterium]|jgi:hypothetical protein
METNTALKARQLVAASQRTTLDPFTEVDWSLPIDDQSFHLPPEKLPLYGTLAWAAMTDTERHAYSRHECAALCAAGIWFENMLMQTVLRHLSQLPVTDPAHRYLLVEVADECRHSMMFGEYIRRAGTPEYAPDCSLVDVFGPADTLPGGRAMAYLLILAVEELLDVCNRATMRDERVHPVSRQMAKLHVLEEARHMSFAKTYLAEVWPTLPAEDRAAASAFAPHAVGFVADLMVHDGVYSELGIADGAAIAHANPHHRERIVADLAKLTGFLAELGVIEGDSRDVWVERGLAA